MSLRQAASDDEDRGVYESDDNSYFEDSSDDEEMGKRLAPRTAPSEDDESVSRESDHDSLTEYNGEPESHKGPVDPDVKQSESSNEADAKSVESGEILAPQAEPTEGLGTRQGRKPLEPYEVPTSGRFWMHDDRQGSDEEASRRREPRKKLFSADSDGKWLHDKFELLTQPPEHDNYRGFLASRGRRGRGPPDGHQGHSAEPDGRDSSRRGRRGGAGPSTRRRATPVGKDLDVLEQPPGFEVPSGRRDAAPRGRQTSRRGTNEQAGGTRSPRAVTQELKQQSRGRGNGRRQGAPQRDDEWPELPGQPASQQGNQNGYVEQPVDAKVSDESGSGRTAPGSSWAPEPSGENLGWVNDTTIHHDEGGDLEDPAEYAPPLSEAAIGLSDPFSIKPVARPVTISAPDDSEGQYPRGRDGARGRGRGRRFLSPPAVKA
eukprot:jgi/Botrbrau1/11547/Bobra.60_1s0002.1